MAIHVHYDDEGRLSDTQHFLYRENALRISADVNTREPYERESTVWLRIGTTIVYLSPVQAEEVLARLATAVEKAQRPVPVVIEVSV